MDRHQTLNMLFDGDDRFLLSIDAASHLAPESPDTNSPSQAKETPVVAIAGNPERGGKQNTTAEPMPPVLLLNSDSDEGLDEYLASFSRAARKASAKKVTKNNQKHRRGNTENRLADISRSSPSMEGQQCFVSYPRSFCPLAAVSRFPYKYIENGNADAIAKGFFDAGKFWNRCWDLYYIYPPSDVSTRPLVLVPSFQVQELLDNINEVSGSKLSIPQEEKLGFLVHFEDDGTPQPQYLGVSSSRDMKETMEQSISPPVRGHHEPPAGCTPVVDRSFAAFKLKMEAAVQATRRKSKASKGKRQREQIQKLKDWCRAVKRTQCYMGLRPRRPRDIRRPEIHDGMTWEEQQQAERDCGLANGAILLPFDVQQPAPFPFASEPIFICVDVESNERCHDQITEIGISTLDTLDLVGIPPGEGGCQWMAKIRSRHFRISELSYVINKNYVSGCPDKFEFGNSEWVSIQQAAAAVDSCFHPPYSANFDLPDASTMLVHGSKSLGVKRESVGGAKEAMSPPTPRVVCNTDQDSELETNILTDENRGSKGPPLHARPATFRETEHNIEIKSESEVNDDSNSGIAGISVDELPSKPFFQPGLSEEPTTSVREGHLPEFIPDYKRRQRNLVFLGHDTSVDMKYLRSLGCTIFGSACKPQRQFVLDGKRPGLHPCFLEALDTSILFRVLKREIQPTSLGNVLLDLGLTGWHLHNAGNDARYTMEAMIRITLKSRLQLDAPAHCETEGGITSSNDWPLVSGFCQVSVGGDEEKLRASEAYDRSWKAEIERRVATRVGETEAKVRDECARWEAAMEWRGQEHLDNDVDGGDGMGIDCEDGCGFGDCLGRRP